MRPRFPTTKQSNFLNEIDLAKQKSAQMANQSHALIDKELEGLIGPNGYNNRPMYKNDVSRAKKAKAVT